MDRILNLTEEERQENRRRFQLFLEKFSVWCLFDPFFLFHPQRYFPSQRGGSVLSWVLVEDGSMLGLFHFVPRHLRVGPWSLAAIIYSTVVFYLTAVAGAYFYSPMSHPWWSLPSPATPSCTNTIVKAETELQEYEVEDYDISSSPYNCWQWWYHVLAPVWMIYIHYLTLTGVIGPKAYATYTVQSWTLLTVRHMLCAVAPWSEAASNAAEIIRFPAACSACVTFGVWNFVMAPTVYFFMMKTKEERKRYLKFITSFRLTNLHVFNIVLCIMNCGTATTTRWFNPARELQLIDFYVALLSVVLYIIVYLFIFDRLGIHIYPIFSPRSNMLVIACWTLLLGAYGSLFFLWKSILQPPEPL